jgi:hypothetical protein
MLNQQEGPVPESMHSLLSGCGCTVVRIVTRSFPLLLVAMYFIVDSESHAYDLTVHKCSVAARKHGIIYSDLVMD